MSHTDDTLTEIIGKSASPAPNTHVIPLREAQDLRKPGEAEAAKVRLAMPHATLASGELGHAASQLHTLDAAGLPIPQHLQEWLKQHGPTVLGELIALRAAVKSRGLS